MSRLAIAIAAAAFISSRCLGEGCNPSFKVHRFCVRHFSKPIQGFSHVVGSKHFVGYFVMAKDGCAVTVINATVRDRLIESPRSQKIAIPAGGHIEVQSDHGRALGIGCTADADAIKVVALKLARDFPRIRRTSNYSNSSTAYRRQVRLRACGEVSANLPPAVLASFLELG